MRGGLRRGQEHAPGRGGLLGAMAPRVAEALQLSRVRADGREEPPREELAVVVNFENQGEQEDRLLEATQGLEV